MADVLVKHTRQYQGWLFHGRIPCKHKFPCLFRLVHSRYISVLLYFEGTELPLGNKPIFKRSERHKLGTSHVIHHLQLHCLEIYSQWCTCDVIRHAPGQTGVRDEDGTDQFSNKVSRRLIAKYVDLLSLDEYFHNVEAMEENISLSIVVHPNCKRVRLSVWEETLEC